jgi:hypothetical protein
MAKRTKATARQATEKRKAKAAPSSWRTIIEGDAADQLHPIELNILGDAMAAGEIDGAIVKAYEIGVGVGVQRVCADPQYAKVWERGQSVYKAGIARRDQSAKTFKPKIDAAVDTYQQLCNDRGDKKDKKGKPDPSNYTLRRKAASKAGITEKTLRNHLPSYLR